MKDIFADFYNKVLGFFRQSEKKENAKDVACNRLRVVLMQDRTNLTPELMERMRKELIELLSRYVEMDKEALELNFEQEGDQMALMLSIPVLRAREESEIEKELAALDAEKAKKEEDAAAEEDVEQREEDVEQREETSKDGETQEEIIEIVEAEPVDKAETSEGKPSDEEKVVIEEEIVISEPENEKEPKIEITD